MESTWFAPLLSSPPPQLQFRSAQVGGAVVVGVGVSVGPAAVVVVGVGVSVGPAAVVVVVVVAVVVEVVGVSVASLADPVVVVVVAPVVVVVTVVVVRQQFNSTHWSTSLRKAGVARTEPRDR